jgi:hypothetical protein
MIPFWPDPSWYQAYWYGNTPPRWRRLRSLARGAWELLLRAFPRRALAPARPLIERHVR